MDGAGAGAGADVAGGAAAGPPCAGGVVGVAAAGLVGTLPSARLPIVLLSVLATGLSML